MKVTLKKTLAAVMFTALVVGPMGAAPALAKGKSGWIIATLAVAATVGAIVAATSGSSKPKSP